VIANQDPRATQMSDMITGEFHDVGAARTACRELGRSGFPGADIRLVWSGARPGARVVVRVEESRAVEAADLLRRSGAAHTSAGDPVAAVKSEARTEREAEVHRATHTPGGTSHDVF
jgi:hypothetical protein